MKLKNKTVKKRMLKARRIAVTVILLTFIIPISGAMAQSLEVNESSGTETSYTLSNVKKLSFSSSSLVITQSDNSTTSYALSGLSKLSFSDVENGVNNIESSTLQNIAFYPNPVENLLYIDLSATDYENGVVQILSLSGKVLKTTQVNGESEVTLDASQLSNGIYLCQYINGTNIKTVKIIKK